MDSVWQRPLLATFARPPQGSGEFGQHLLSDASLSLTIGGQEIVHNRRLGKRKGRANHPWAVIRSNCFAAFWLHLVNQNVLSYNGCLNTKTLIHEIDFNTNTFSNNASLSATCVGQKQASKERKLTDNSRLVAIGGCHGYHRFVGRWQASTRKV